MTLHLSCISHVWRLLWAMALACVFGLPGAAFAASSSPPLLLITEPSVLQAAERSGAAFGRWFDVVQRSEQDYPLTNARLARSPLWQPLTQPLQRHLQTVAARDPLAGVGVARYSHRLFDMRWLRSEQAFFELIAVVNRMDRRPFHDQACGETRLIYRLGYRSAKPAAMASRLPMTVSVELRNEAPLNGKDCSVAARRWQSPSQLSGADLGRWLTSPDGPLADARLQRQHLAQVAINVQTMRWPSAVRPDLGGHAEYLLHAFRWNAQQARYEVGPLENTPDLARLQRDAKLRNGLLQWLQAPEQLRALDEGTLRIAEPYLATESLSVTPRGLERLANRPFQQLYGSQRWSALPGSRTIASSAALLRRLDDMSCAGCHQSRAVAGFHLLGDERAQISPTYTAGNRLAVGHSPHVQDELTRRLRYVQSTLTQGSADPFRPPAERGGARQAVVQGGMGAACGLGDPGFAGWQCAAGLRCEDVGDVGRNGSNNIGSEGALGVCMPAAPTVGAMCEPGPMQPDANPLKDRALPLAARGKAMPCGGGLVCEATAVGFPGGMCSGSCAADGAVVGTGANHSGSAVCGRIAVLDDFNRCLAQKRPFSQCLQHTRPGLLQRCSASEYCREDYICAAVEGPGPARVARIDLGTTPAAMTASQSGACMPPYFLFQMRVDGHP